jgi:integrase
MFRLGAQADKGLRVPQFPTIAVHNARRGFFERDQFEKVLAEVPDYLQPLATVAYWTGWRKGELLRLERRQIDLDAGTLRLDPGTTKNKEGRSAGSVRLTSGASTYMPMSPCPRAIAPASSIWRATCCVLRLRRMRSS